MSRRRRRRSAGLARRQQRLAALAIGKQQVQKDLLIKELVEKFLPGTVEAMVAAGMEGVPDGGEQPDGGQPQAEGTTEDDNPDAGASGG